MQGSLVFLAVLIGVIISGGIQASYQPFFWKQLDKAHKEGKKNHPEGRLPPMMLGAVLFAAGLFWFGGSSANDKPAAFGIVGAGCIGMGFILIFQNAVNYLIDTFTVHAASAQAANTFLRSLAGAGFPLFATPMFKNLGVNVRRISIPIRKVDIADVLCNSGRVTSLDSLPWLWFRSQCCSSSSVPS